jgi:senataxin
MPNHVLPFPPTRTHLQEFYNGDLKDAASVVSAPASPWYQHPCFGPLAFYNVAGKETVPEGAASIVNKVEAEMVLCVYHNLTHAFPQLRKTGTVAVISPYKAQVGVPSEHASWGRADAARSRKGCPFAWSAPAPEAPGPSEPGVLQILAAAQVTLLRKLFAKALGDEGAKAVDINTIDGFQGREKDVVLFSCVRSSK